MGKINLYNYAVVAFVSLGSYTFGFTNQTVASVLGLPGFLNYFGMADNPKYNSDMAGAMNGLFFAGGLIGALCTGKLADVLGRKNTIRVIAAIGLIGGILSAAAVDMAMWLTSRFITGACAGMVSVISPLYNAEVAPPKLRGLMVGSHGVMLNVGYTMASWLGLAMYFVKSEIVQWRLYMAFTVISPILLFIGSFWLPESPRWLIYNNRDEEGLANLRKLHHQVGDPSDHLARAEFYQIKRQIAFDRQYEKSWIQLWKVPSARKRLLTGFFLIFAAESTGVLVINNYQVLLYANLGITGWKPLMLLGVYLTYAVILNAIAASIIDRVGRVIMMTIGMIGCSVALCGEAAIVAVYGGSTNTVANGFGVFFLFLFLSFFGCGIDDAMYVYISEIFPTWMRGQGVALSIAGLFSSSLIYTGAAATAFSNVGWKYFLVFIIIPLFAAAWIWFCLPETKGLPLEEIGRLFGDEVAVNFNDVQTDSDQEHAIEGRTEDGACTISQSQSEAKV